VLDLLVLPVMLGLAVGLRLFTGTWLHPSTVFASAWTVFLFTTALLLPGVNQYSEASIFVVFATVLAALGAPLAVSGRDTVPHRLVASPWLARFSVAGFFTGLLAALINVESNGRSFAAALSAESLISSSQAMTAARYNGSLVSSPLATVLLAITYGAAMAAPFAATSRSRWRNALILAAPSAGGAAYALLTTARAGLLIAASLSLASWIVVKAVKDGGRPRISVRSIAPLLFSGAAVAVFFLITAANRYGGVAYVDGATLGRTVGIYAGASTPALGTWLGGSVIPEWGVNTFSGVSSFFVRPGTLGVSEFVDLGAHVSSNVFTAFRPLVEDFTQPGALAFVGVVSILASYGYRRAVLTGHVLASVLVSSWISFVLFSQSASLFTFTNVVVGVVLAGFLVCRLARFESIDGAVPRSSETPGVVADGRPKVGSSAK
jgi:oligosaccharide repeat unit polymerase